MKITELLKVTDENWVRKAGGYRVRFHRREGGKWVLDYMPGPEDPPLDSDVVAWRSAWKLLQSSRPGEGEFVNLTVVDDLDQPVRYFANGELQTYNQREDITISAEPETRPEPLEETEASVSEAQADLDARGSEAQPSSEESNR